MNKEERVLRTINKEDIDYLPSQINFADKASKIRIAKSFGFSNADDFDSYLDNHYYFTTTQQDKPMFFHEDREDIARLSEAGFCIPDYENNVIYDNWGIGIQTNIDSFNVCYHPLQGKTSPETAALIKDIVPEHVLFADNLETAIREYETPEPDKEFNFIDWEKDLKTYSGEYLVWPSGYFGTFERAYGLTGWAEFVLNIGTNPTLMEELLDKIANYKIQIAKKVVKMGFKIAHHGDDLGTQRNSIFSPESFRKHILPYLKKEWEVYRNAGIPIQLHSCGHIEKLIPDLIDIGLNVLEPCQPCMDLKFLKKEYGQDITFFGGVDTQRLPFMTPEEVGQVTKDVIWTLGKGGGYVFAPSQEIMNDVPIENIRVLVDTLKEERVKVLGG